LDGLAMTDAPIWTEIIMHHSATRPDASWEGIRDYHMRERGWRDIGYHFGVGKSERGWEILPGRSLGWEGSHCPGHNRTAIGICLLGDFTDEPPPEGQLQVASGLVADLMHDWKIPIHRVYMHRQFRDTECPGAKFNLEHFRNVVMGTDL